MEVMPPDAGPSLTVRRGGPGEPLTRCNMDVGLVVPTFVAWMGSAILHWRPIAPLCARDSVDVDFRNAHNGEINREEIGVLAAVRPPTIVSGRRERKANRI